MIIVGRWQQPNRMAKLRGRQRDHRAFQIILITTAAILVACASPTPPRSSAARAVIQNAFIGSNEAASFAQDDDTPDQSKDRTRGVTPDLRPTYRWQLEPADKPEDLVVGADFVNFAFKHSDFAAEWSVISKGYDCVLSDQGYTTWSLYGTEGGANSPIQQSPDQILIHDAAAGAVFIANTHSLNVVDAAECLVGLPMGGPGGGGEPVLPQGLCATFHAYPLSTTGIDRALPPEDGDYYILSVGTNDFCTDIGNSFSAMGAQQIF